ncbi:DUF7661 family protein [Motilibacter aurantiacus]|uniref:DUF7661 family protein n=1 Tax=Motilibacter aurantiacus TaxID=2714955 RepID=UPI00140E5673|nr:hypothetical protein [Motilibacter aurantiacus]NHC43670.1 hypothetical protein [Motilibacter aurantiacus]
MQPLWFDVYGRLRLEIVRDGGQWRVYRLGDGTRRPDPDVVIAPEVSEDRLLDVLAAEFSGYGEPGRTIRRL